jgi:hypothetical protein
VCLLKRSPETCGGRFVLSVWGPQTGESRRSRAEEIGAPFPFRRQSMFSEMKVSDQKNLSSFSIHRFKFSELFRVEYLLTRFKLHALAGESYVNL